MPQARTELPFSRSEYDERIAKVRAGMASDGLDVLLVYWPENIYYLTGYDSLGYFNYQLLVVPASGEPFMVVRRLERQNALQITWLSSCEVYQDWEDPAETTAAALRNRGLDKGRLGVELDAWFLTTRNYLKLADALGADRLVDASQLVNRIRLVKSPREIEYIRAAARTVEAAAAAAIGALRVGATENDSAAALYAAEISAGSEYTGHASLISSGPRSARSFATWSGRRIEAGDPISLEPGGSVRRYHASLIRTLSMGKPRDETIVRMAEASLAGLEAGLAAIKPGVTPDEVDRITKEPGQRAGFGQYQVSRSGYSIGIGFPPDWGEGRTLGMRAGEHAVLQPNMTFHFMNIIWYEGVTSVGFSETIRVTESGCEPLTNFRRELIVVD
jgi:Xaa-Pro dipeptidase